MNFVTGKQIPRRTFLRGAGATVALPFLDAMLPAGRPAAAPNDTRLICIEQVHGAAGCNEWGASQFLWNPEHIGRGFDLSPTSMRDLEPFQDYLTIISNTDCRSAESYAANEIGGDHFRSTAAFLTQSHPKRTQSSDVHVGTSLDQLYAQRFGQDTPFPSMQLCIEPQDQAGGCAYGYSCVYTDSVSWASPSEPLPMIRNPRTAFDMMFGSGGTADERAQRRRSRRSILDAFVREVGELKRELGGADVQVLDKYLENVREIERRIERVEARNSSGDVRELPAAPVGVPDSFVEHVQMMFDLQVLALQSDVTRVFTLKFGRDGSGRVYPESGINKGFHPLSHHGGAQEEILDLAKLNTYHVSIVPYLLERLKATIEGDKHLLDKTVVLFGSPMADPNLHTHRRCPLFLVGRGNGALQGGVHLKAPDGTPMANAMLVLLQKLGFDDLQSFGDSTGAFQLDLGERA